MKSTMSKLVCTRCVMDTSDPDIYFDSEGVCNHCHEFSNTTSKQWFPNESGRIQLEKQLGIIRAEGKAQEYDCILGLSGGVDSSFMALKAREWGLRPLVMHIDAGWNSELAVANIEAVVKHCNYDLHTHVIDWGEMRDLQLAYFKAGIANQDVPQDHAFFAGLYNFATRNKIKYILSGGNIATEGIFPRSWHGSAMDAINLRAIHKKFGTQPLIKYPTVSFFQYFIWYPFFKGMRTVRPLNFIPYNKNQAIRELEATIGWKAYGRKHGESLFTRIFQNYYLPTKFGYDKRLPHLSSLIASGQLTREQALIDLSSPLYDSRELEIDINYFCKKLRITREYFDECLKSPNRHHSDFPTWDWRYRVLKKFQLLCERIIGKQVRVYS
jgi:N-acetyl sugar amidotransferase